MMNVSLEPIDPNQPTHLEAVAGLWTGACGHALATSPRAVAYMLRTTTTDQNKGVFAWHNEEPVGAVIINARTNPHEGAPAIGAISLIAVLPETERQGVGKTLLSWAEDQLRAAGCTAAQLGGGRNAFVPGLPAELPTEPFFMQHGYQPIETIWDMAANLATYQPPSTLPQVDAAVRTAQPTNVAAMRAYMQHQFPQTEAHDFEQFLHDLQPPNLHTPTHTERISDYMILWTERGIDGLCRLNFEDSYRPIERFYPYQLPRPWGQVGHFGISADIRGQGFGATLIDASLRRLHNNGVNGCIIRTTTDIERYTKFGFQPSREYTLYQKEL